MYKDAIAAMMLKATLRELKMLKIYGACCKCEGMGV
jgi:hypothetical protein